MIRLRRLAGAVAALAATASFLSWGDPAGAAVAFRAFSEAKASSGTNSITLSLPAGTSQGDLLIAAVATDGNTANSLSPPAGEGWTEIAVDAQGGGVTLGVWWKLAAASESPTHQFTWNGNQESYAWMMRFDGHDPTVPVEASAANGGTSSTPTAPAVTTTLADTMILRLGGFDDDDVTIDSPGLSGHSAITMDESGSGNGTASGGAGYVVQASIGSSGTATFSLTASEQYRTVTLAIPPAIPEHFAISHDGSSFLCVPENITIAAHDGAHTTRTSYSGTITLSTSTSNGDWSLVSGSGTLNNAGNGSATYTFDAADSGQVVLGLYNRTAETLNIDVADGSAVEHPWEDPDLTSSVSQTVLDQFSAVSYTGDDGTASWSNDWQEQGEGDGPAAGEIRVDTSGNCASGSCGRLGGFLVDINGVGLLREADLSGATSATLTFSYRRSTFFAGGSVLVQASGDGGSTWTTLQTYPLNASDAGQVSESLDITSYIASDTQIQFLGAGAGIWASYYFDDVQIAYSAPTACGSADHFEIGHDGTALNCQAENVTITAHDALHAVVTTYSGTITLSTSTSHGDWSLVTGSGTLTNSGAGSATYSFDALDNGQVVLGLRDTYVETLNINLTDGWVWEDAGEDADLAFAEAGFVFLADGTASAIGTQIGGKASNLAPGAQSLELQAIRTSDTTGACESFLTGVNTVELAFECENPTSCTANQVSINGTAIAANPNGAPLSYTSVSLDFGDASDTTAALTLAYPDVGQIQLHARLTLSPSGLDMLGASNSFVVRPFAFHVSVSGNPGAQDVSGSVFTSAGTDFTASARAVLWEAADDADADGVADNHDDADPGNNADLSGNAAALNYGQETPTQDLALAATLYAPSGGNDPGLGGGTTLSSFSAGSASSSTVYYGEVGVAELSASVSSGDYLGIGAAETSRIVGRSGFVGRFTPDSFDVSPNTPQFESACDTGGFSYLDQSFSYVSGSEPVATVTARNAQGTTTQNYTGSWFRITPGSLTGLAYASASGTLSAAAPNPPTVSDAGGGIGIVSFDNGPSLWFQRSVLEAPFDAEISLSFNVLDLDGVAYASNPFAFGAASAGNGIAFDNGKSIRFGRLAFQNAHGSELVALPVPLLAEYYDGSSFVVHTADACTSLAVGELSLTPNPAGLPTAPSIANAPLLAGEAGLSLSPPGPGNTGTVDLLHDLGSAGLTWLRYDWDGDGFYDDDPTGRATFGVFSGDDPIIYLRELY